MATSPTKKTSKLMSDTSLPLPAPCRSLSPFSKGWRRMQNVPKQQTSWSCMPSCRSSKKMRNPGFFGFFSLSNRLFWGYPVFLSHPIAFLSLFKTPFFGGQNRSNRTSRQRKWDGRLRTRLPNGSSCYLVNQKAPDSWDFFLLPQSSICLWVCLIKDSKKQKQNVLLTRRNSNIISPCCFCNFESRGANIWTANGHSKAIPSNSSDQALEVTLVFVNHQQRIAKWG